MRWSLLLSPILTSFLAVLTPLLASEPDLTGYRTVENALTAKTLGGATPSQVAPGYLGLHVAHMGIGNLVIAEVDVGSPAAKAGIQKNDVLLKAAGKEIVNEDAFHDLLRLRSVGDTVALELNRKGQPVQVSVKLAPLSQPMRVGRAQAVLGVRVATVKEGEGVVFEQVTPGSAADRARLKAGEILLKVDGVDISSPEKLGEVLAPRQPDDMVTLTLLLAEKAVDFKVRLGAEQTSTERRPGGFGNRMTAWTRPTYRLAIICIEYPDTKHNPKIPVKAWEESMFSKGTYTKKSVTGQTVYGSLHDYYREQSYGKLTVEGKAFEYVEVSKKRSEYATGNRTALLTEALDKLLAREGKEALKDYDGVYFLYAGGRYPSPRGSLYWPHRANVAHNGKRWPYFICPEGGETMGSISVFCHEFGHMLGLPDLYASPENPGMEGVGVWCAMANQVGNGRPQQFCAWSKERLGWVTPTVIDPRVKQKLVLAPIEDSQKECFKIPLRADGSEYFLLENRRKKGFDQSLPAEGLLIWRVVGSRPILQESHGIEGASGPRQFLALVPYPSESNDSFTPYTTPSSRSQLGGGFPVHVTNIRRLPDGRIAFHVGYEYQ